MDIGPPASGKDNIKMSYQSSNERLLQEMQTALPQVPQSFPVFRFAQHLVPYSEVQLGSKCTLDLCQKQSHGFFTPPHRVSVTLLGLCTHTVCFCLFSMAGGKICLCYSSKALKASWAGIRVQVLAPSTQLSHFTNWSSQDIVIW